MYTVGLVPSPGVAHEHVTKIIPKIKQLLTQRINDDSQWNFEVKEDLIIGSAEDVHESVDKAEQIKNEKHWDFAICVTDLPSISGKRLSLVISIMKSKLQCYHYLPWVRLI